VGCEVPDEILETLDCILVEYEGLVN
jgi:hypothetical protein